MQIQTLVVGMMAGVFLSFWEGPAVYSLRSPPSYGPVLEPMLTLMIGCVLLALVGIVGMTLYLTGRRVVEGDWREAGIVLAGSVLPAVGVAVMLGVTILLQAGYVFSVGGGAVLIGAAVLARRSPDRFLHVMLGGLLFGGLLLSVSAVSALGVNGMVLEKETTAGQMDRMQMQMKCNRLAERIEMYCETGCGNQTGQCDWREAFDPTVSVMDYEWNCVEEGFLPEGGTCPT